MQLIDPFYLSVFVISLSSLYTFSNAKPINADTTDSTPYTAGGASKAITLTLAQPPQSAIKGYPNTLRATFRYTLASEPKESRAELISLNEFKAAPLPVTIEEVMYTPATEQTILETDALFLSKPFQVQEASKPLRLIELQLVVNHGSGEVKDAQVSFVEKDESAMVFGTDIDYYYDAAKSARNVTEISK